MMKGIFWAIVDRILNTDVYMSFHWIVLIGLWVSCFYQLWHYEFGNVLCMAVAICAWKMKGVEE